MTGWPKVVLVMAAIGEAATGLALLVAPSLVASLLFGEALSGVAIAMARLTGIALMALAIACWPGPPLAGMWIYGAAATLYLAYVGWSGHSTGLLLWPAVALHAVVTALLSPALARTRRSKSVWRRVTPGVS